MTIRIERSLACILCVALLVACAKDHQVFVDESDETDAATGDATQSNDARTVSDANVGDGEVPDASADTSGRFGRAENCGFSEQETLRVATKYSACFPDVDMESIFDAVSGQGLASTWSGAYLYHHASELGDCEFFRALLQGTNCEDVYALLHKRFESRERCSLPAEDRCNGHVRERCTGPSWLIQAYSIRAPLENPDDFVRWYPEVDCAAYGETCVDGQCTGPILTGMNAGDACNLSCPSDTVCEWIGWGGEAPLPMCHEPTPADKPNPYYSPGNPACDQWGGGTDTMQCDGTTWTGCIYGSPLEVNCEDYGYTKCDAFRGCHCEKEHENEPNCGLWSP